MNRRVFLVSMAVATIGVGGITLVVRRMRKDEDTVGRAACDDGNTIPIALDDLVSRPDEVRPLGRAVLATERVRPSRASLAARLFQGDAWGRSCRDGAKPVLLERVRDDFRENRTVIVQGWVLSRTEADLYALAELVLSSA